MFLIHDLVGAALFFLSIWIRLIKFDGKSIDVYIYIYIYRIPIPILPMPKSLPAKVINDAIIADFLLVPL